MSTPSSLHLAIVGAGPAGLALALLAARQLPDAQVSLFDARPADRDVSADPRTLALSLGSVHLLQHLGAWEDGRAQPITEVHVSQQPPTLAWQALVPQVRLTAADQGVAMLGAVLPYGALVAPLQRRWQAEVDAAPQRLHTRFGTPVAALKDVAGGVEIDAGVADRFDLAIVAEGGVFADRMAVAAAPGQRLTHDYRQTAWVGTVTLQGGRPGLAVERFTRHGPAALLPLGADAEGQLRAALVWCVPADDDPVKDLDEAQRLAVLNTVFPAKVGRLVAITPLKQFALGLAAERTLVRGRQIRIGNAAQTLHPVAGQGLNLGLRDAYALARALRQASEAARLAQQPIDVDAALRKVEWQRAPDRWAMIAATDFLARSFTWTWPGMAAARGLGLAVLDKLGPAKKLLARQMMFGRR
ncbi:FAD-dependent monooxygenase [Aquincola tertiaricarbonis]|uniref:FAD-dependent monooxygenase n=1 Tax=Aquincola tertiaricarbonis TaxID=391953 RepID=A0ABY4SE98_AQUTE|nr:FAD-dependent monooxygenase [Aquincola tertiaricarbonis]URI10457.1 FAD-dependent monooxygenase [Aquincola tertiaricarbonis]